MSVPFDWGVDLPLLEAPRVVLRGVREADAPALLEVFGDAEVMRYWSSPRHRDLADAAALIREIHEHFEKRTLFQWGIARREDDRAIGTVTLFRLDHDHRRAEIGFALGRAHWGRGLVHEALAAAIRFAFGPLHLHRIEADVDPRNARSLGALERHRFRREGHLRERYHVNGEVQDTVFLGLLRDEWREPPTGAR